MIICLEGAGDMHCFDLAAEERKTVETPFFRCSANPQRNKFLCWGRSADCPSDKTSFTMGVYVRNRRSPCFQPSGKTRRHLAGFQSRRRPSGCWQLPDRAAAGSYDRQNAGAAPRPCRRHHFPGLQSPGGSPGSCRRKPWKIGRDQTLGCKDLSAESHAARA